MDKYEALFETNPAFTAEAIEFLSILFSAVAASQLTGTKNSQIYKIKLQDPRSPAENGDQLEDRIYQTPINRKNVFLTLVRFRILSRQVLSLWVIAGSSGGG